MRRIAKQLMLGLDEEQNLMYSPEEAILGVFNVGQEDVTTRRLLTTAAILLQSLGNS
jgi:hypothetical protein